MIGTCTACVEGNVEVQWIIMMVDRVSNTQTGRLRPFYGEPAV